MSKGPVATQTSFPQKRRTPIPESGTDNKDHVGDRGDLPGKSGLEGNVHTAGSMPVS